MDANRKIQLSLLAVALIGLCHADGKHEPQLLGENNGECEWVQLPICQSVSRSWANFPNQLGHRNQIEVAKSSAYRFLEKVSDRFSINYISSPLSNYQPELMERCRLQVHQVACSFLAPKCVYVDEIRVTSLPPCKSTCIEVQDRCTSILRTRGLDWPDFLRCEAWIQCHLPSVCRHSDDVLVSHTRSGKAIPPISLSRKRKIPRVEFKHHTEQSARKVMTRLSRRCPEIMRLYTVGKSIKKKPLYVMEISENPGIHETLEPEVKYIGGIHGNEVLGRELLLQLMQYICGQWLLGNKRIRMMMKNTRLHIMPTMNPDGYNLASREGPERNGWLTGRFSSRGYDLNRQFPDLTKVMYMYEAKSGPNHHLKIPTRYWRDHKQALFPEIHSVIRWIDNYDFILSAQLHGGELVANYPYDLRRKFRRRSHFQLYSKSPDDELFRHLSTTYAESHLTMADADLNTCDEHFGRRGGITNGAEWYSVSGGMQDFNYLYSNCFEILLELSCRKFPPASALPTEWNNNRESLLTYIEQAHIGIKGVVANSAGDPIEDAIIHVNGIEHDVTSNKKGEYWRLLLPGKYTITASKGRKNSSKRIIVRNNQYTASRYDFILLDDDENYSVVKPDVNDSRASFANSDDYTSNGHASIKTRESITTDSSTTNNVSLPLEGLMHEIVMNENARGEVVLREEYGSGQSLSNDNQPINSANFLTPAPTNFPETHPIDTIPEFDKEDPDRDFVYIPSIMQPSYESEIQIQSTLKTLIPPLGRLEGQEVVNFSDETASGEEL